MYAMYFILKKGFNRIFKIQSALKRGSGDFCTLETLIRQN